ncbi:MAG: hypothetical protein ACKVRP_03805 [Bacteroidota bacterium]
MLSYGQQIYDTPPTTPSELGPTPLPLAPNVITTADGYDNFDIGVDSGEPHIATNPTNPLWYFNAFNVNRAHNTINGHDWTAATPSFGSGFSMRGDPIVAYDSLGNLYYENMFSATAGGPILGCKVMVSSNNGTTWSPSLTAIDGVDKNWIACDQTAGPFANYVYTGMTASGGGNFARSTDFGASWINTWTFGTQSLPGMMVAVAPDVLAGNNISGGCVYVVTNSGPTSNSVYTFYRSTDGGETFDLRSSLTVAGYVGTLNSIGRLVINNARTRPYPFIAADNSYGPHRGRLYLVYASNVPVGNGNKPDIFLQYSTDQGTTWSTSVQVNDNADPMSTNEWFPAIWCDKETGRLYIKWYDMRNDPTNQRAWVYGTYTDDGGQTFAPNQKISNQDFVYPAPACGANTNCYRGDYDGITSNAQTSMSVWTDFRNGNYGSFVGYFPDFAMQISPTVTTMANTDSANITVKVPGVKLYTATAKFSVTVSPAAAFSFVFPEGDSLTTYPDSLTIKMNTSGVSNGAYTVTVTGQGPNGTPVHKRTIAITVQAPSISIIAPNGGESWQINSTKTIQWSSAAFSSPVNIELSRNGGVSFTETLFSNSPNDGSQSWLVTGPVSATTRIRISGVSNPAVADTSTSNFSIVQASITLAGPNGVEEWGIGSSQTITWSSVNMSGSVRVLLSRNGGVTYAESLFASTPNDGSQSWTATAPVTSNARIKIESIDVGGVADSSDADFAVVQATISLVTPNGGEVFNIGDTATIQWSSTNLTGNIRIELSRNGGLSYSDMLFSSIPDDGSESWVVAGQLTHQARIRITGLGAPGVSDVSNANFSIAQMIGVSEGWNLVAVPLVVGDPRTTTLFPTASSPAYDFTSKGYQVRDSLENGKGYWLKFAASETVPLVGGMIESDTIEVPLGWSLLGSISYTTATDSIEQTPPGILLSIFSYQTGVGYQSAPATIEPGQAVWIKTSQAGALILKREPPSPALLLRRNER